MEGISVENLDVSTSIKKFPKITSAEKIKIIADIFW